MSVNKAIILGNLGRDPEVSYLPSGSAVCNLSIATSERWKDQNGQDQERTEWHRVTFFGKPAEVIGQHMNKGSSIYIEGRIQTRKYQDKETGQDRYATEIIGREFQFVGPKASRSDDDDWGGQLPAGRRSQHAAPPREPSFDDFDDDIPF